MSKGIERVTPMLKLSFRGLEIHMHGVRQDVPPLLDVRASPAGMSIYDVRESLSPAVRSAHREGREKSGIRKRLRYAPGARPVTRLNSRRKKAASS